MIRRLTRHGVRGRISIVCAVAISVIIVGGPASAQAREQVRNFAIAATPLSQSVLILSEQAGIQVIIESGAAGAVRGSAVNGALTPTDALDRLLAGTNLTWRWLKPGVVTIEVAAGLDGERVTAAVRVEGASGSTYFGGAGREIGVNGTNGSRDVTATEGTGSFTSGALTVGSKAPQAIKDVPQSVSVLTREQIEQQNLTDFNSAMRQLPGITLVRSGSSLQNDFFSRGFQVSNIQVDGGAPLPLTYQGTLRAGLAQQFDMSMYDHVELLRGASGLFDGYGDPSGTVNLVRKKPLDHARIDFAASTGSWRNQRIVADATSPIALDGGLRARVVATYQRNEHFYAVAQDRKALVYGVAELDASDTTLLTLGSSYTRQNSTPWVRGLPRYFSGADLGLPRSTSFVFPWNRWRIRTTELFGAVNQTINQDWTLKGAFTYLRGQGLQKAGFSTGPVDPLTNKGPRLDSLFERSDVRQFSSELTAIGAVNVLGQRQEITLGVNRTVGDSGRFTTYVSPTSSSFSAPYQPYPGGPKYCFDEQMRCPAGTIGPSTPPIDVFAFDPRARIYSEPPDPLPSSRFPARKQVQLGGYVNLRLTALDRLHLNLGVRWNRTTFDYLLQALCIRTTGDCAGRQIGDVRSTVQVNSRRQDVSWPPTASLSYDLTQQLAAYVGYTDVYGAFSSFFFGSDLRPIEPITGSNLEAGVKWAADDGRLNITLSAYRIRQRNFPVADGVVDAATGEFVARDGTRVPNGGRIGALGVCCFRADPDRSLRSVGIDLEATGRLAADLQVAASYIFSKNDERNLVLDPTGRLPFSPFQPDQSYKIWLSYDPGLRREGDPLSRLGIAVGVNGQSSAYVDGVGCRPEAIVTGSGGTPTCKSGGTTSYRARVPAYAVLSGRISYRASDALSVAFNVDNMLDRSYYQTTGGLSTGNWYGPPRSATISLRSEW